MDGAKRIRTADPLNAIEVLYQLSYSPMSLIQKRSLLWLFFERIVNPSQKFFRFKGQSLLITGYLIKIAHIMAHQKINGHHGRSGSGHEGSRQHEGKFLVFDGFLHQVE